MNGVSTAKTNRGDRYVTPILWFVSILTLIVVFSCSTLTVIAFAQAAEIPEPIAALGLSRCDSPCYLGLAPGASQWSDADRTLQTRVRHVTERRIIVPLHPRGEVEFYPSVDGLNVGRIFVFLPPAVQVGWVLEVYGTPCGLSLYPRARLVTIRYPNMLANLSVENRRFSDASPVSSLQFTDPAWVSDLQPDLCIDNVTGEGAFNMHWRGVLRLRLMLRQFGMID